MQIPVPNNLGGNINQDLSKALLKPEFLYNSENYRVVTTGGATTLSRTNILGNTFVSEVTAIPKANQITIDDTYLLQLYVGEEYSFDVEVNTINLGTFTFTYSTKEQLLQDLADWINTQWGSTIAVYYNTTQPQVVVTVDQFTNVVISNFVSSNPALLVNYTQYLDKPTFNYFSLDLNSWVPSPALGNPYGWTGTYAVKNGLQVYVLQRYFNTNANRNLSITQTLPVSLPTGDYEFKLYHWSPTIFQGTSQLTAKVGGVTIGTQALTSGTDYSGIGASTPQTFTGTITPGNNDISLELADTVSIAPATFVSYLWRMELKGPGLYNSIFSVDTNYISGTQALYIIGWEVLRDDIYLFTTDCTTDNPGNGDPASFGQIWKLSYDKTQAADDPNNYTLTLIYNNELNFSTKHPIFNPGRVVARYESPNIQKLYWTDNYNVPRFLNVADPNALTLAVNELELLPSISFDVPILNNILKGGNLKSGMYQYVYRLKRNNGAETRFSMPSRSVFLTVFDEQSGSQGRFINYEGVDADTAVDKTIEIKIDNIDTSFDRIEVAFIYYGKANASPIIQAFYETNINGNSTMLIKHSGEEDSAYPLTVDETTSFTVDIQRVKAIAAKYNTMFYSNVKVSSFDPQFDSRAYRFPLNSTTTVVKDSQGSTYTIDSTQNYQVTAVNGNTITTPYDLEETHDCIQEYDSQSPFSTANNLYLPNSATPAAVNLGGSGPNISYSFETLDVIADEKNIGYTTPTTGGSVQAPYREVTSKVNTNISLGDRDHPNRAFYECFVSPYFAPLMAGYQRDEMYRFAIVFFDLKGNPGFAKWIADIRFPHMYMPNGTNKEDRVMTYPIVDYNSTTSKAYTKPMYIKFTVDVSSIQSEISGFQICIVPRTNTDKHIIGQGIFAPAQKDYASIISGLLFYMSSDGAEGLGGSEYKPENPASSTETWHNVGSLKSPDFDFRGFPGYQSGDSMEIIGLMDTVQSAFLYSSYHSRVMDGSAGTGTEDFSWTTCKYYDLSNDPLSITDSAADGPIYTIHESWFMDADGSQFPATYTPSTLLTYNPAARVGNFSPSNSNGGVITRYSRGSRRVGFVFGDPVPATGTVIGGSADFLDSSFGGRGYLETGNDGWELTNKTYLANYRRSLQAQYGGNAYGQRATNLYVPCSNFFKINSTGIYTDALVAGGDTYTVVYDTVYDFMDWWRTAGSGVRDVMDPTGTTGNNSASIKNGGALTFHFPVETTINIELRGTGDVPNMYNPRGDSSGSSTTGLDNVEDFISFDTDLFSWNPNIIFHTAKPINYQDITEYDVRTFKSEPKNNSEDVDSWTTIKPFAFLDVESKYGPINNLIVFRDKLLYFQDRGFGVFQVAEKQVIQDPTNISDLVLGTSGILERYDYISNVVGSKLQSGFAMSNEKLVFTDILSRKIYTFSSEGVAPLSDIKGLNAFLYRKMGGNVQTIDNPYENTGITATYDHRYNEFLISFLDQGDEEYFTLVYNQLTDGFTGFYSFYPKVYINDKLNIFSVPALPLGLEGRIYVHDYGDYCKFYDGRIAAKSKLSFIVNHEVDKEKVLTNFEFVIEAYSNSNIDYGEDTLFTIAVPYTFFDRMRVFNSYQNTDWFDMASASKRRKTLWNVKIPGNKVLYNNKNLVDIFDTSNLSPTRLPITQRLKDRWFMVDTEYDNTDNYKFIVTSCNSLIALNPR